MRPLARHAVLSLLLALLLLAPGWGAGGQPTCSVCGKPVSGKVRRLSDGRLLCAQDAAVAVMDPRQASEIFWSAVAAVNAALGPEMRLQARIDSVDLVDRNGMRRVTSSGNQVNGDAMGLFRLTRAGDVRSYKVYLLDGLPPERLATIAAHEYGHAWQAENNPRYSEATRRVREGFAEWVAYKMNTRLGRLGELAFMAKQRNPDYVQGLKLYQALERAGGTEGALRAARTKVE